MINIRYHIVSITAVFLALGIGVALGSTFLDRATVSVLDRNIRSAENRIRETNGENDRLNEQLDQAKERDTSLVVVGSESLMEDQLADVPVLVITAPGVDQGNTAALDTIVERTGADYRGTVRLSDRLAFSGDVDTDLAQDLGVDQPSAGKLRTAALNEIIGSLRDAGVPTQPDDQPDTTTTTTPGTTTTAPGANTTGPDGITTTTTAVPDEERPGPDGSQPEGITTLIERGYLSVDPGPGYEDADPILETTGYRYIYVGAPDLDEDQNDVLLSLLPATGEPLPATVISASQAAPTVDEVLVPTVVARVRDSEALESRYNTVDNTETFAGLTATVFTLQRMGEVEPGQYGQADGATAVLPPPS